MVQKARGRRCLELLSGAKASVFLSLPNKSLEPTRLSRVRLEGRKGSGASRFTLDVTAAAAWRLSSGSLGIIL
jgi:hypothetical protein